MSQWLDAFIVTSSPTAFRVVGANMTLAIRFAVYIRYGYS
jgi:hypothetical protein